MSAGERVAEAARTLVGVRFRPQGRCVDVGVDCIGLAAIAWGVPADATPRDYDLRMSDAGVIGAGFRAAGFVEADAVAAGDVLVVRAGFSQAHAVVLTPGGFVHADAGLRRVVEVPGAVPWPISSVWRLPRRMCASFT